MMQEITRHAMRPGEPARTAGFRLSDNPQIPAFSPVQARQQMAHAPVDRCLRPGCAGKLGVTRGVIRVESSPGVYDKLEDSERCRRQSYVACTVCRTPV